MELKINEYRKVGVSIGDNSFIGYGVIILPGVTLAKGIIVAAVSVVTKSVDKEGLSVGGNHAKIICTTEEYFSKKKKYMVDLRGMSKQDIINIVEKDDAFLIKKENIKYR